MSFVSAAASKITYRQELDDKSKAFKAPNLNQTLHLK
jgi:hypothetical protein